MIHKSLFSYTFHDEKGKKKAQKVLKWVTSGSGNLDQQNKLV